MTEYSVGSGQQLIGVTLHPSDSLYVNYGGFVADIVNSGSSDTIVDALAVSTTIYASGIEDVYESGVASGTTINHGKQYVYQASAYNTTVNSGGLQSLFLGGSDDLTVNSGATVSAVASDLTSATINGGYVDLLPASTAEETLIGSGGILEVDGATTSGTYTYKSYTFDTAANADDISVQDGARLRVAGGITSNTSIYSGGEEDVFVSGTDPVVDTGTSYASYVFSGGLEEVYDGVASGTVVENGGSLQITYGTSAGTAFDTVVSSGGFVAATYGGETIRTSLLTGASEYVWRGGEAISSTVYTSATLEVDGEAIASGTILDGGTLRDDAGLMGSVSGTVINAGGIEEVFEGVSMGAVVNSGGSQQVIGNGLSMTGATDTVVNSGGELTVGIYGSALHAIVTEGGSATIDSTSTETGFLLNGGFEEVGGSASTDTIRSGGEQLVYGDATSTSILNGGDQAVFGSATAVTINAGGTQTLLGQATSTIVNSGGVQSVERSDGDFGVASGTVLHSGALQSLYGGSADQTVIGAGATEDVVFGSTFDTTIKGGTLILEDADTASAGIVFAGAGGKLVVAGQAMPDTVISGFLIGDTIDLESLAYAKTATATLRSGNILVVSGLVGGTQSFELDPKANYSGKAFKLASDGQSGTFVTVQTAQPPPPIASNDSYSTTENTTLTMTFKGGVLANDKDPGGHTLTAILVNKPVHGTLTLNKDGSFNYVPNTGYIGSDTFSYKAFDGTQSSASATVSLKISPPPKPSVIAGAVKGQTTTDATSIHLFSKVTITDPNAGATDNLTITLTGSNGKATDADGTLKGTGLTKSSAGTYVLSSNSPSALTKALQALTFMPTKHQVGVGKTVTTGATITDENSLKASTSNAITSVIAKAVSSSGKSTPFGYADFLQSDIAGAAPVATTMTPFPAATVPLELAGAIPKQAATLLLNHDPQTPGLPHH